MLILKATITITIVTTIIIIIKVIRKPEKTNNNDKAQKFACVHPRCSLCHPGLINDKNEGTN